MTVFLPVATVTMGIGAGYLSTQALLNLSEAGTKYAARFSDSWTLIQADPRTLTAPQKDDRTTALKEWNAFSHAYVAAKFVENGLTNGLNSTEADAFSNMAGLAKEKLTEVWGRLTGKWTEEAINDRNKDLWNNEVGRGLSGLTDEQKADYLENQILDHRLSPNTRKC